MSEPIIYEQITDYLLSCTSIKAQIEAIDLAISKLLIVASSQAGKDNISQYEMNNGQTIIRLNYKSAADVTASITSLRRLRNDLVNDSTGRAFRLIDAKSFY